MTAENVAVSLGARAYDIVIGPGLLERSGAFLSPLLARPKTVVVTDENVDAAQGDRLRAGLDAAGISAEFIILTPGEATKSFAQLESLLSSLLDLGVERSDLIIAFGGGVIGDLTGFAAAILRRGCRFVQIPTSLLAQVDSAVGGKTAINVRQGKNLIGAFHQPALVIADLDTLSTLPDRERRAGYAEIVKYGAIDDALFFAWLEQNGSAVLASGGLTENGHALRKAVKTACEKKAAIVKADERETGKRALLNLGHTFGHALEAAFGYSSALLHGEAVAAGIGLAFEFSVREGHCSADDCNRIKAHLRKSGLPADISDIARAASDPAAALDADRLFAHMMQDKKNTGGALTLILARAIGDAFIVKDAPADRVRRFLKDQAAGAKT